MNDRRLHRGSLVTGIVFVVIGIAFLLESLGAWQIAPEVLWPSLLIAVGGALLLGGPNEPDRADRTDRLA